MASYDQDNGVALKGDDLRRLLEDYPRVTTPKIVVMCEGAAFFIKSHMVSCGPEQELVLYAFPEPFAEVGENGEMNRYDGDNGREEKA